MLEENICQCGCNRIIKFKHYHTWKNRKPKYIHNHHLFGNTNRRNKGKPITFKKNKAGCHICTSHSHTGCKYPVIKRNYKQYNVHRWIWLSNKGKIPKNLVVRHKCDNYLCININHLELGTSRDNSQDMVKRNRSIRGERHPLRKLTKKQVIKIRKEKQLSNQKLSEIYKVTPNHISNIKNLRAWRHINA